jgi:hypothetical protein
LAFVDAKTGAVLFRKQFDEAVYSVAISKDGTSVAVGLGNGYYEGLGMHRDKLGVRVLERVER